MNLNFLSSPPTQNPAASLVLDHSTSKNGENLSFVRVLGVCTNEPRRMPQKPPSSSPQSPRSMFFVSSPETYMT